MLNANESTEPIQPEPPPFWSSDQELDRPMLANQAPSKRLIEYSNKPFADFGIEPNYTKYLEGVERLSIALRTSAEVRPIIDGQIVEYSEASIRHSADDLGKPIAIVRCASERDADIALTSRREASEAWGRVSMEKRVNLLLESSSIIKRELIFEVGVAKELFAFLPRLGEMIGRRLETAPEVDVMVFSGSKEVGLDIRRNATTGHPGQSNIKSVITELGARSALVVDEHVDIDQVVPTVPAAAFGFAGRQCSAPSRLIMVGEQDNSLLMPIKDAAGAMRLGTSTDLNASDGPVIAEEAGGRIREFISVHRRCLRAHFEGSSERLGASFVPPHIFADGSRDTPLWRTEILGPVLYCYKADSFEEGLAIANDTEYTLTDRAFSSSIGNLRSAAREHRAGKLYFDREITGALVGKQPVGGFGMPSVGPRAGGSDYVHRFVDLVTVSRRLS